MHRGWQLLFQTDSHLQENTCRLCRFKRAPAQSGSLIMIKKLQAGTGTGIKGSEMRPGSLSSPRGGSRLADSCGHPVHRVFNPKPSVCTGITKPTWGPLPPPHRVMDAALCECRNCSEMRPRLFLAAHHHHLASGQGARDGTRARYLLHGPLPMRPGVQCLAPCPPPYHQGKPTNPFPSVPQVRCPISSFLSPVLTFLLPLYSRGLEVLRNTMVRPPPDDNIVEWEPFSFPTASWAMLSGASSTRSCA